MNSRVGTRYAVVLLSLLAISVSVRQPLTAEADVNNGAQVNDYGEPTRRCDPIAWGPVCTIRELTEDEWDIVEGAMWALDEIGGVCSDLSDIIESLDVYTYDEEVWFDANNRIDGQAFCDNCNGSPEYSGQLHFYSDGNNNKDLTHEAIHYYLNISNHTSEFRDIEDACSILYHPVVVATFVTETRMPSRKWREHLRTATPEKGGMPS